jgi:hypothetical protein
MQDTSLVEIMKSLWDSMSSVFALIDVVEPRIARMLWSPDGHVNAIGRLHSYFQSVLRWEHVLVRLAPQLRKFLERVEFLHRAILPILQKYQDHLVERGKPVDSLLGTAILFEDFVNMSHLVSVDPAKCKAARSVLECQLRFLLARQFDLTKSWKSLSIEEKCHLAILNCVQGIVPCIVPRHHISMGTTVWRAYLQAEDARYCQDDVFTARTQCVERPPELDECHHELHASRNTSSCFCGWIIASLPLCLLAVLGLDVCQISPLFHNTTHFYYSIRKVFARIATPFCSDNTFLTSTLAAIFRYTLRLTIAKCLRQLAATEPNETTAPIDNVELFGEIIMQSLRLLYKVLQFRKASETKPESFTVFKKDFGMFFAVRDLATSEYGEELMDGVW